MVFSFREPGFARSNVSGVHVKSIKAWFHAGEILREKTCLRNMDGCARVILLNFRSFFAFAVSKRNFYSLRKRKKYENSIESLVRSHPYFANTSSREEFRRRGIRPLDCQFPLTQIRGMLSVEFAGTPTCSSAESNVSVGHSCRIEQAARKRYHNSTIWIQLVNHTFCNTDLVVENVCCKGGFPLGGIFRTKGKFLLPSDHRMELIDILLNLNRGKPA